LTQAARDTVKTAADELTHKHDAFLQIIDSMNLGNIEHILGLCDEIKTKQEEEIELRKAELERQKLELNDAQKDVAKAQQEIAKAEAENADKIRALYMLTDKHSKQLSYKIMPLYAGLGAVLVLLVLLFVGG
jgi:septal ring factor EnvC (AmiA/AmiB activator)